jgi:glucokinase
MSKKGPLRLLLAGDIGGTKTRLGLFSHTRKGLSMVVCRTFLSRDYDGLETIISEFLGDYRQISAAAFGIAGPIVKGSVLATNLPWAFSERSLVRFLAIPHVALINDLVANAYGITVLSGKDFAVLQKGKKNQGNAALLSAGTGLGASILFWDGKRHRPSPSEGGHIDFGPKNRIELELLKFLFERFGHVSYERILSGPGLLNIYQFLKYTRKYGTEPEWLSEQFQRADPAAVVTEAARLRKNRLCSKALDMFASIYGAAAGNLALQVMALEGIYLGGGIAPKIIWKLKDGTFMKAFTSKGRLSSIVEPIPVKVVMNDNAALLGAAVYASRLMTER